MVGITQRYPGNHKNKDEVVQAAEWFEDKAKATPLWAELRHYKTVSPDRSDIVTPSPEDFKETRRLYATTWKVRNRFNTCPSQYRDTRRYNELNNGVKDNQRELVIDSILRQENQAVADHLLTDLEAVFSRWDFYREVKFAARTEPEIDKWTNSVNGTWSENEWGYGHNRSSHPDRGIQITSVQESVHEDYKFLTSQKKVFAMGGGNKIIVGWRVDSKWNDGTNGKWRKQSEQILAKQQGEVQVKSEGSRGFKWTIYHYTVDAQDYQFDD